MKKLRSQRSRWRRSVAPAKSILSLIVIVIATLSSGKSLAESDHKDPLVQVLWNSNGISVSYGATADAVDFVAVLPVGWDLQVLVDGNQDGWWGHGDDPNEQSRPREDLSYTSDHRNGYQLCAQYVYSSDPANPDAPRRLSRCGDFASQAEVTATSETNSRVVTTTYTIPASELFGSNPTARVVFTIWDGKVHHEFLTLSKPLIITRTAAAG